VLGYLDHNDHTFVIRISWNVFTATMIAYKLQPLLASPAVTLYVCDARHG
jgi:hypothetical protein